MRSNWTCPAGSNHDHHDQRRANLTAALGFLQLPSRASELQRLHRWLDTWTGVGLITVGVERQGYRLSLSHITEGEWRARFMGDPMISAAGYGVAPTPWQAVRSRRGTHYARRQRLSDAAPLAEVGEAGDQKPRRCLVRHGSEAHLPS
jgi:hypothetical protein